MMGHLIQTGSGDGLISGEKNEQTAAECYKEFREGNGVCFFIFFFAGMYCSVCETR